MQVDNRCDLTELESVEVKAYWLPVLGLFVVLFLSTALYSLIEFAARYWAYTDDKGILSVSLIILVLSVLWVIYRILSADYHWKTDANGLTTRGILRRRFMYWPDITEVAVRPGYLGHTYCEKSSQICIRIPFRITSTTLSAALFGSIWQNARKHGATYGELPEISESLWDLIPDELPREMDWENKNPRFWYLVASVSVFAAFVALAMWFVVCCARLPFFMALGILGIFEFAAFGWLSLRQLLWTARSVKLRKDHFEIKAISANLRINWSNVMRAQWSAIGSVSGQESLLEIATSVPPSTVYVPYDPHDEASGKLILALIRRLRSAGVPQALTIPDSLRAAPCQEFNGSPTPSTYADSVELKFRWWELAFYSVGLVFLLGCPVLLAVDHKYQNPPLSHVIPILGGSYLLGLLMLRTYRVHVDGEGISKRFLWWAKSVRWSDVARCEKVKRTGSSTLKLRLKDMNGTILIDATPDVGSKADKDRYNALLFAKLGEILPRVADESWKARPWRADG